MMNRRAILYVLLVYFASEVISQYRFPVHEVNSCPKNRSEWYTAGARLNCSYDGNNTLQYLCIPNKNITTLLEFCYDRIMGFNEKGNCLLLYPPGNLTQVSCTKFRVGCPEQDHLSSDLFNYSSCLEINKDRGCFEADLNCDYIGNEDNTIIMYVIYTYIYILSRILCYRVIQYY
ncbi:uncharacterized protein LOC134239672 [Saccostrea cucullata]|uniref:uncharacterized protein LOC134239672 n=1 Tax=Saccostrea cuccullata TaxID=36930 RepID=UPI002ED67235